MAKILSALNGSLFYFKLLFKREEIREINKDIFLLFTVSFTIMRQKKYEELFFCETNTQKERKHKNAGKKF